MPVVKRNRRPVPYHPPEQDIEAAMPLWSAGCSHCLRCGGFLVPDSCFDLEDELQRRWCWILRCVQCGDVIDPVILTRRSSAHKTT